MDKEFEIGDIVMITADGHCYTTYATFSLIQGVDGWLKGTDPDTRKLAKVINKGQHESNPRAGIIYVIEQENQIYIMSPKGLELHAHIGYKSFCNKTEIIPNKSDMWNTKCRYCGHDAYDSGFSYQCSRGCHE